MVFLSDVFFEFRLRNLELSKMKLSFWESNWLMATDEKTHTAYTENAGSYSQDWLSQPEPTDIYKLIKKYFIPNGTTADIGCGNGRDSNWMSQNGFQVSGFDSSTELLKLAQDLFPKVQFNRALLPNLNEIINQYDNVFCETVIMHLPKTQIELAIKNLKRILKPNGVMYLSGKVIALDLKALWSSEYLKILTVRNNKTERELFLFPRLKEGSYKKLSNDEIKNYIPSKKIKKSRGDDVIIKTTKGQYRQSVPDVEED